MFLCLFCCTSFAQDSYFEEPDMNYFKAGTLLIGGHWNQFDPIFNQMNYDVLDQTGAYDLTGTLYADSTTFVSLSNYFGIGFNLNGIQCLMSASFRRTSQSSFYQLGFGMGFNQILHFSYKTGRPLVWFEGLINYNYLKHNTRLRSYDITQPPMMVIDGTQFPDLGLVSDGSYHLNVEFNKHIIEPVAAINFSLSKVIGLRFSAAYSLFLNGSNADLVLRFKPLPEDANGAKADQLTFNRKPENINIDGNSMTRNHLDLSKWNFNISFVLRILGEVSNESKTTTYF